MKPTQTQSSGYLPVLGLEGVQRRGHLSGGQLLELLLPDFEALLVDPQFARNLPAGLPAHQPVLHRLALEGFVIPLILGLARVVHVLAFQLTHSPSTCPPNRGKANRARNYLLRSTAVLLRLLGSQSALGQEHAKEWAARTRERMVNELVCLYLRHHR